jgi:hypothetical protein
MPNNIACASKYPSNDVEMAQRFHLNVFDAIKNDIHNHGLFTYKYYFRRVSEKMKGVAFSSYYNIFNQDLTMNTSSKIDIARFYL